MIAKQPAGPRLVGYARVSTEAQGRSGLGLEAQENAIREHVARIGGELLAPLYIEIESGRRRDRPELHRALAHAKRTRSTLVVAKLDRLARSTHFISGLLEAGVEFVALDVPSANRLVLQVLAAVAEEEARAIGARTRAALAARRARGLQLGNLKNLRRGNTEANARRRADANAVAERLRPVLDGLSAEGVVGATAMSRALAERGYTTASGAPWHVGTLGRALRRLGITSR